MSDPAWIVLLPLIGAVVGAFGGAWANSWYRDREAKQQRDQELKGLTLLLFAEIGQNEGVLVAFKKFPEIKGVSSLNDLRMDIWVDSRVRLAQLVTNEHTSTLVAYYKKVQDLIETVNDASLHDEIKDQFISGDADKALRYGKAAMMHGGKYMFPDSPEYTDEKHAKFVEEARKLMNEETSRAEKCTTERENP